MKTPRDTTTSIIGVVAGLAVLALLMVFAVLLPKVAADAGATGGDEQPAELDGLALPDDLPGGFTAIGAGVEGVPPEATDQIADGDEYASEVIAEQVDGAAVSRRYVAAGFTAEMVVQVFAAESGPQVPATIIGPPTDGGAAPIEITRTGPDDAIECVVTYQTTDQSGAPVEDPPASGATCQQTGPGLTVKVQLYGGQATQGLLAPDGDAPVETPAAAVVSAIWDDVTA